jgi:glycerophosphoryl diester phosphodiesterase
MSDNVHILSLSAYTTPTIQESKRDNWVDFGEDNNFYSFLIDRYTNSTTNSAIINNISRLVYGKGLSALDANRKPNEYAQMMALFNKDCVRKMVIDRKMLGQFAIQVHYNDKHDKILKAYHMPVNLLRAEKCNKDGDIQGYYYSDDWTDVKKYAPVRYSAFGTSKDKVEILFCKPYAVGMKYYAYPDYQGALPYALLEEEIADYLINEVQNGFSGTKVVNFNNGVPTEEQQAIITSKVMNKLTGSRGQKVIVAFNDNAESKTTVEDIPLNDAPEHYTYLSEECLRKIMLGHNVTSPLLFGVASSNGFSSNAEELKNSAILFDNMVIRPFQEEILEAFDSILAFNGISLKLYFRTLQPLEFVDLENAQTADQVAEETGTDGTQLSSQTNALIDLGEDADPTWVLIDEKPVDYDNDDLENENLAKEPKQSLLNKIVNLVSTGDARPNITDKQDKTIDGVKFVVRYKYEGQLTKNPREFCTSMVRANKIYRKQDILNK